MKTIFTIGILFLQIFAHAQFLQVDYSKVNNTTISNNKNFSDEMKKKVAESEKNPFKYRLCVANGNSYFFSLPRDIVSVQSDETKGSKTTAKIEILDNDQFKMYKKSYDDKAYIYYKIDGYEFYGYDGLKSKSINYKNDTQLIENYICKLVEITNERDEVIKIWYTEGIPVSAGPFSYNNFPGLVLKVEAPSFVIYATEISNKAKEEDVKSINKKLPVFSGDAFSKKMRELFESEQKNRNEVIKL